MISIGRAGGFFPGRGVISLTASPGRAHHLAFRRRKASRLVAFLLLPFPRCIRDGMMCRPPRPPRVARRRVRGGGGATRRRLSCIRVIICSHRILFSKFTSVMYRLQLYRFIHSTVRLYRARQHSVTLNSNKPITQHSGVWGDRKRGVCQYGMTPADSAETEVTMRFPVENCYSKV